MDARLQDIQVGSTTYKIGWRKMNMIFRNFCILIPVVLLLYGCSSTHIYSNNGLEKDSYRKAILDAAVIELIEIKSLPVIDEKHVKVVTWTAFPDSYKEGKETILGWETYG